MSYVLGININESQPVGYNLCKLYGINYTTALDICTKIGLNPLVPASKKLIQLGIFQDIQTFLSRHYQVGTLVQKQSREYIKKQIQIKSYRGMRHRLALPVRGQRTHTNRMTQRRSSKV